MATKELNQSHPYLVGAGWLRLCYEQTEKKKKQVVFKVFTLESVISVQDLKLIMRKWHAPAVGIRVGQTGNR